MAVSTGPKRAQCEPSLAMRTNIMTDLNIKGLVTCPDSINMEDIIPVYDFSKKSNDNYVPFLHQEDVGGDPTITYTIPRSNSKRTILELRFELTETVAGRLADVGVIIWAELRQSNAGGFYSFAQWIWQVGASAGNPMYITEGIKNYQQVGGITVWNTPIWLIPQSHYKSQQIEVMPGFDFQLYWYRSAGNFPVGSSHTIIGIYKNA